MSKIREGKKESGTIVRFLYTLLLLQDQSLLVFGIRVAGSISLLHFLACTQPPSFGVSYSSQPSVADVLDTRILTPFRLYGQLTHDWTRDQYCNLATNCH